jgi:hypothetical protein
LGDRRVERLWLLTMARHPHDIVPRDEKDEVLLAIFDVLVDIQAALAPAPKEEPVPVPARKRAVSPPLSDDPVPTPVVEKGPSSTKTTPPPRKKRKA